MTGINTFQNIYIHIPFCSGKCTYCGFYSELFTAPGATLFMNALEQEMAAMMMLSIRPVPDTLYIGGGTPSLLPIELWVRLFRLLHRYFDFSKLREWTVEANPGTVSPALASLWQQNGVTRVSLGVQSMNDATLVRIGRRHNAVHTIETLRLLQQHGFARTGLDLIAGLPGVSPDEWYHTLLSAMAMNPSHVSVYACSVEPGSHLHALYQKGQHHPPSLETMESALVSAATVLSERGYEHYEISNYAKPGDRCLHNINVWKGADYLGFGPGAASRRGIDRWINIPDLEAYCATPPGACPPREQETLSPERDVTERLIFHFRLMDPVSLDAFAKIHGEPARQLIPYWQAQLERLSEEGLVLRQGDSWRCTEHGRRLADSIAEALLP